MSHSQRDFFVPHPAPRPVNPVSQDIRLSHVYCEQRHTRPYVLFFFSPYSFLSSPENYNWSLSVSLASARAARPFFRSIFFPPYLFFYYTRISLVPPRRLSLPFSCIHGLLMPGFRIFLFARNKYRLAVLFAARGFPRLTRSFGANLLFFRAPRLYLHT